MPRTNAKRLDAGIDAGAPGGACLGPGSAGPFVFWVGAVCGAAAMYFLDPARGRRRRHVLRDRVAHAGRVALSRGRRRYADARNHIMGVVHEARTIGRPEDVPDDVLEARVRAEIGHVAHHLRRVEVAANDGVVTLRGTAPEEDVPRVAERARHVRGVAALVTRLTSVEPRAAA
ncbi:MAG TPA: BON domain-containing protein [Chloroflexota bacterium]|nr:BON domain-containing protein [Chloroflexota bacterium]